MSRRGSPLPAALAALVVLVCGLVGSGCTRGFGYIGFGARLVITLVDDGTPMEEIRGTPEARLPLSVVTPHPVKINIEMQKSDGTRDVNFNSFVRLSTKPGSVHSIVGDTVDGRNVQLEGGIIENVVVNLIAAFGDTRIWADDIGYIPADPLRIPPPDCSDGKDNNGNGLIDYPADPGCAFPNDDAENHGTLASGASPTLYFSYPRVADVRGVAQGGAATPFPHEQVVLDTGFLPQRNAFRFSVVVTRIASDGFYVTDLNDRRGYSSVFVFNFNAPPRLRVCDRLTALAGTAIDFFGFTELSFPTWAVEEWNRAERPCLVPEPYLFDAEKLRDVGTRYRNIAALVRVWNGDVNGDAHTLHVASHFGPEHPAAPDYLPQDNASNCDLDGDGSVDFSTEPERTCASKCDADVECAEWSSYVARSDFQLVLRNEAPDARVAAASIQANATAVPTFRAFEHRGQPMKSFTGTLRYFSGGAQFTIEARCNADIVLELSDAPVPMDEACVLPRTGSDNVGH